MLKQNELLEVDKSKANPFEALGEVLEPELTYNYNLHSEYIEMRDGVKLAATILIPKDLPSSGKVPTLLHQTRYWRAYHLRIPYRWVYDEVITQSPSNEIFTDRGYAIVYIDVRGCGASYGSRAYPWTEEEIRDGADVVDWIITQEWSDGRVISKGISYPGICVEKLGYNAHSAVKALIIGHAFWDPYNDVALPGGCYDRGFMQLWSFLGKKLDENSPKAFREIGPDSWVLLKGVKLVDNDVSGELLKKALIEHKVNTYVHDLACDKTFRDDTLMEGMNFDTIATFTDQERLEKSKVPILAWCSYLDSGYCDAIIHRFMNLSNPQIAILGSWNHGASLPANQFFPEREKVSPSIRERINSWVNFSDICVTGKGIEGKTLYYYTLVEEKWKKTQVWPPEGQFKQRWYFSENFSFSESKPEVSDGADDYKINFRATTGRNNRWWALLGLPITYAGREKMDEKLLTYSSQSLDKDLEITGFIKVSLFMKTTHDDGAIYAYFEDVDENGKVTYIADGQLRLLHRKIANETPPFKFTKVYHTYKRKDALPVIPGEIMEVTFSLHITSVLIKKGHRFRIAIAGHDKDTFYRYPAEGRPTITLMRSKDHASYIELPIIKGGN